MQNTQECKPTILQKKIEEEFIKRGLIPIKETKRKGTFITVLQKPMKVSN